MATSNDRTRARYGICLSDSCPKCKDKTIQIITGRKDFVCEECGKPLREVPRPLTGWEKHGKKVIGAAVAVVVIGGAAAFFTLGGKDKPEPKPVTEQTEPKDSTSQDSVAKPTTETEEPAAVESKATETENGKTEAETDKVTKPKKEKDASKTSVQPSNGKINLGYGTYKGESKNGKPHGHGTITYTSSHRIVASKDFIANPGDKFEGEFRDGIVSGGIGYWYHDGDITAIKP